MKGYCDPCAKSRQVEYQKQYRERQKAKPRIVTCKGCNKDFDASQTGRTWRCSECTRLYLAAHREKNRQWHVNYSRNYRARLGDEYKRRMLQRQHNMIAGMSAEDFEVYRQKQAVKSRRRGASLREAVFSHYGKACACCGENEPMFLSIDHVDNNGSEMRRNGVHGHGGSHFYYWLKSNGFPAGFQTLCMNCNSGKYRNGGICPHQAREGVTTIPEGSRAKRPEAQRTP